jgi:hypothetical protein
MQGTSGRHHAGDLLSPAMIDPRRLAVASRLRVGAAIRRRMVVLGAAAALLALPAALFSLPATSAHAGSRNGVCESSELCLFEGYNYTGTVLFDSYAPGPCWTVTLPGWAQNRASSYANRQDRWAAVIDAARPLWRFGLYPWEWNNFNGMDNTVDRASNCL